MNLFPRLSATHDGGISRDCGLSGPRVRAAFCISAALRRKERVSAGTTRWLIFGVAWLALAAPLEAQTNATGSAGIGCLRIRPAPFCRSYWILEVGGVFPVASSKQTDRARGSAVDVFADNNLEFNLGHMINASSTVSVGGVVALGSGSGGVPDGARARVRWWATPKDSFELEAGIVRTNLGSRVGSPLMGPSIGVRLTLREPAEAAVFIRYDRVNVPAELGSWEGGSAWGVSLGASVSGGEAVVVSGLIGLGSLLLVLILGG